MNKKIAGLTLSLGLPLILIQLIHPLWVREYVNEPLATITGLIFMWLAGLILLVFIYRIEHKSLASIGIQKISMRQILIATGLGFLLSMLIPSFYYGMNLLLGEVGSGVFNNVSAKSPFLVLAGVSTASITEEFLFRGYPIERMEKAFGNPWPGALISILFFTTLHLQSWNLSHIFGVVLPLGIILTLIYLKTRNLMMNMIIHFFIDLPLVIMAWLS